jgi:prophage antirepressor-like protein
MTPDALTLFENHEIRTLEKDGVVWFPITDLATAWGIDRTTPHNIIVRNPDVFENLFIDGDILSQGFGRCVNECGLYTLMGKISTGHVKNPDAKKAIIRFQKWVPQLIQKYRKKEIVQIQESTFEHVVNELEQAKKLHGLLGGELKAYQAIALKKSGMGEYVPAMKVPAIISGEPGVWFNPTQLGARCNPTLSALEVNRYLYNKGYQYPEGDIWRLQPKGEDHAEEYWFEAQSKHQEIRIRWRESILFASGLVRKEGHAALPRGKE